MKKMILDVRSVLHNEADAEDQCIDRLMGSLEKRTGVHDITLRQNKKSTLQLHIHFDAEHISAERITYIARQTGKKLDHTFGHLWIKIQEVHDNDHCLAVTALLKNFKGVINVLVVPTGWIFLEFNTYITQESILRNLIKKMSLIV
jgi:hypothetical protein